MRLTSFHTRRLQSLAQAFQIHHRGSSRISRGRRNLAEIISDCLADKSIEPHQVLPTVNAILVDKYDYVAVP